MSYGNSDETHRSDGSDSAPDAIESAAGMSPYATGGGGVTFERKVAVKYLAHLLVGDGTCEFGDSRRAVSVAFQQAPDHPVDDVVVYAASPGELERLANSRSRSGDHRIWCRVMSRHKHSSRNSCAP